ncbi:MAG TPA: hypothetical protein VHW23_03010 [Kofleriaceae bacterium]|jgi:hypothetical protein|nr:hypothetical protein [Kofleriaceae bacterium]
MTMARAVSEIDRLIEEGLSLYGEGDLDGALLLWERVLVIEPDNAQANSYVDYVRMNYELLTSDSASEDSGPFGIDSDEPEYQIEISPGDGAEPAAPLFMDDPEGWGIGDERGLPPTSSLTLELEADEPPAGGVPGTFDAPRTEGEGEGDDVSFEDATREYPGGAGRPTKTLLGYDQPAAEPADFSEITPGFGSVEDFQTPQAFSSQPTDVRRRDLGFVQPSGRRTTEPDPGPPELKMTLRTPSSSAPPPTPAAPAFANDPHRAKTVEGPADAAGLELDLSPDLAPDLASDLASDLGSPELASPYSSLELDLPRMPEPKLTEDLTGRAETRRTPGPDLPGGAGPSRPDDDLVATLPTPRPGTTRPLPSKTRPPAFDPVSGLSAAGSGAVSLAATLAAARPTPQGDTGDERPTRDLTQEPTEPALKAAATAPTQELPYVMKLDPRLAIHPDPQQGPPSAASDFADKPTNQFAGRPQPSKPDQALITAPTRELGLRELAMRPAPAAPAAPAADRSESGVQRRKHSSTEDEITGVDVHRAARTQRSASKPEIPGMDPIDARSTDILEEVDRGAPATETREERTRRRITVLLERAATWGRDSDFDRAVTAVDLALSEDPNSALAQKLIHRNREAIMNAFQAFLGDLQRTPSLARPLHELGSAPISPRAAFLLSRVDGTLSLDEILDVSGMPRMEAYRYLCQLFLRGILR